MAAKSRVPDSGMDAIFSSPLATGNFSTSFSYSRENTPNADVLIPSLRQSGYSLESAIGDLVDNCIDAGADVIIVSLDRHENDWEISIADNGVGMDLYQLDQMMRLGSRSDHDLSTDLGRFGLGSTTASLSLGRQQHVVTTQGSDVYHSAATDLDAVLEARQFVKHLAEAKPSEVELFRTAFERWGFEMPSSGTIVRIARCDNISRTIRSYAVKAVKDYIGTTYRYFLNAGKTITINGETVQSVDPLWRDHSETVVMYDDTFEYVFPKGHRRESEIEMVGVVLVQLPDLGGPEANKRHGFTVENSGLYLLRNRREIVEAAALGLFQRHNELSRFRGELLFPATMDEDLGVTFLKSSFNVHLSQSLRDKVAEVVRPYVRVARNYYNKSLKLSSEVLSHDEATKTIRQKSPLLRKPQSTIERRSGPDDGSREHGSRTGDSGETREPKEPRTQKALADIASFEVRDLGSTAPFYEARLEGRRLIVTYNGQHPFYQRFVLENRDNRSNLTAIDYLTYSLASAELRASDEDTYKFIERMREDASFNLRQLLTT